MLGQGVVTTCVVVCEEVTVCRGVVDGGNDCPARRLGDEPLLCST